MNKKSKKKLKKWQIIIIILTAIYIVETYVYFSENPFSFLIKTEEVAEDEDTSVTIVTAERRTIENTLSSSGQVSTGLDEKVELHASYYFSELLVEQNQRISEGENILSYTNGTYLTAPYDCVLVSSDLPEEGSICTTSHYVEIQSLHTLTMTLNISESDINKVSVGDTVNITLTTLEETITGNITTISEIGSYSNSGSYFASTVTFINNGNIKIGMSATCEIVVESAENVISVPVDAIQTSDNGKYVIVVNEDGSTTNTTVETGIKNDDYIEIKSGIDEGTSIQMQSSSETSSNNQGGFRDMPGGGMKNNGGSGGGENSMQRGNMPGGNGAPGGF